MPNDNGNQDYRVEFPSLSLYSAHATMFFVARLLHDNEIVNLHNHGHSFSSQPDR